MPSKGERGAMDTECVCFDMFSVDIYPLAERQRRISDRQIEG